MDGPASNLTVSVVSSNQALVPNANLVLGGTGAARLLSILPATNQFGLAGITVTVTATNGLFTSASFVLTVNRLNDDLPVITTQPAGRTATNGQSVSFSVAATSQGGPLSYQWRRNGVAVAGATGATLTLAGAQPADAGDYTALVSNSEGSVTSSVATLRVLVPPVITQISRAPGSANVSFTTVVGLNYVVEFKEALTNAPWGALAPVAGTGAVRTVTDAVATAATRFYRVRAE